MTPRKLLLATAALLLASPAAAQTPIASLDGRGVTIQGTVTDVFGNRVILQDATGRTLVDLGPPHGGVPAVTQGERLTVTGEPRENGFRARQLTREDGSSVTIERGPPPRGERHGGKRDEGRRHGPRAERAEAAPITPAFEQQVRDRLAAAGYTRIGAFERKPRHVEVSARNPSGDRVELHVDLAGEVYKERSISRRADRR